MVWFLDRWGYHQENYRIVGEYRIRKHWIHDKKPGKSIYTCRKWVNHHVYTLKPQGQRWVTMISDKNYIEGGVKEAEERGIQNRKTPYWRARIGAGKIVRTSDSIQIATESWELGHKYEYTRWDDGSV